MNLIEPKQVVGNPRNYLLVYNPAGVQYGNVYTDFNDLYDYALTLFGSVTIWIPADCSVPVRTAAGIYDFEQRMFLVGGKQTAIDILGSGLSSNVTVSFDDGFRFIGLPGISKLICVFNNTLVPACTILTNDLPYIVVEDVQFINNGAALIHIFQIGDLVSVPPLEFILLATGLIYKNNDSQYFADIYPGCAFRMISRIPVTGASLQVLFQVGLDSITSSQLGGTEVFEVQYYPGSFIQTQANFVGIFQNNQYP